MGLPEVRLGLIPENLEDGKRNLRPEMVPGIFLDRAANQARQHAHNGFSAVSTSSTGTDPSTSGIEHGDDETSGHFSSLASSAACAALPTPCARDGKGPGLAYGLPDLIDGTNPLDNQAGLYEMLKKHDVEPVGGFPDIAGVYELAPGATRYLPEAVLAAVVMVAALSLLDVGRYLRLWRMDRVDAALSTATLLGVFLVGVLEGLGLAIAGHPDGRRDAVGHPDLVGDRLERLQVALGSERHEVLFVGARAGDEPAAVRQLFPFFPFGRRPDVLGMRRAAPAEPRPGPATGCRCPRAGETLSCSPLHCRRTGTVATE